MPKHRMNHTKRVAALRQITRIYNMLQSSKRDFATFATKRRADLDEELAALTGGLARKAPRRRRWQSLRPQDQERIIAKLARKAVTRDGDTEVQLRDMGIVGPLVDLPTQTVRDRRPTARSWLAGRAISNDWRSMFNRTREHSLPDDTPAERLQQLRHSKLRTFRHRITPDPKVYVIDPEFVAGLHPDDTCWERAQNSAGDYYRVIAARDILRLNDRLANAYPLLAGTLYLEEPATNVEVWYCAMLRFPRKGDPVVEPRYIGRVVLPRTGQVQVTPPQKSGSQAFIMAQGFFAQAMSDILYREEQA